MELWRTRVDEFRTECFQMRFQAWKQVWKQTTCKNRGGGCLGPQFHRRLRAKQGRKIIALNEPHHPSNLAKLTFELTFLVGPRFNRNQQYGECVYYDLLEPGTRFLAWWPAPPYLTQFTGSSKIGG